MWDMVYRFGYLPYPYGHPGYRHEMWANDMRDDCIDTVIFHIDMGYLVALNDGRLVVVDDPPLPSNASRRASTAARSSTSQQGH